MQCPICKKKVQLTDPFMPFCSERCREADLGNWASEKYVISEPVLLEDVEPDLLRDVRRTRIVLDNDVESDDLE